MKKLTSLVAVAAIAALSLAGCSSGSSSQSAQSSSKDTKTSNVDPGEKGFDVSSIKPDPEIEKLVPESIKKSGILRNGTSADYAPGEYRKADGQTPTGYDVDLIKAIGKLMGVEGKTYSAPFDSLIPQMGSKYDVGAGSFTITPERLKEVNMISYVDVGFQYGVAKGNPNKFNPKDPCGKTIGLQTGTAQQQWLEDVSKKCVADGKKAIDIKPSSTQTEVVPKVVSAQYDAMIADAPVVGYAVKKTNGQVQTIGGIFESAKQGIVVPKNDPKLAEAVQKALQKLMDDGTMKKLFAHYGADSILLKKAELNPTK